MSITDEVLAEQRAKPPLYRQRKIVPCPSDKFDHSIQWIDMCWDQPTTIWRFFQRGTNSIRRSSQVSLLAQVVPLRSSPNLKFLQQLASATIARAASWSIQLHNSQHIKFVALAYIRQTIRVSWFIIMARSLWYSWRKCMERHWRRLL